MGIRNRRQETQDEDQLRAIMEEVKVRVDRSANEEVSLGKSNLTKLFPEFSLTLPNGLKDFT
jgi:hypothetical protein